MNKWTSKKKKIATTRYGSGVEHILVDIFMSSRGDSLRGTAPYHRALSDTRLFIYLFIYKLCYVSSLTYILRRKENRHFD